MERLNFKDFNISNELQRAIKDMGFEEATPIQSLAIPKILKNRDIMGQAQTGTGKTAAFGIPLLQNINSSNKDLQAVILCPTRELAIQVAEEIRALSKYLPQIDVIPIYGGQPIERQLNALKKGVQIIIGTPGRVMDHIERGTINLSKIKTVILDEADEMLDMGFREDIEFILEDIPYDRQFLLFSATLPPEIQQLAKRYQTNPEIVKVTKQELTTPDVEQKYFEVREEMKVELLSRIVDIQNFSLCLVFCNTKKKVNKLVSHLQIRGYQADGLHGDLTQHQRDHVMRKFKNNSINILVATDVAARGIDVTGVEAVFNYDIPNDNEYYVHRIGRTGRAGRTGKAYSFVSGREIYQLRDIQQYAKTTIEQSPIPSRSDVEEVKRDNFIEQMKITIKKENLSLEVHAVEKLIEEGYNSIDISAALLNILKNKNNANQEDFGDTEANKGFVRFFITTGRENDVTVSVLLEAIHDKTGLIGRQIGNIDIFDGFTFVEIQERNASDFYKFMNGTYINNKKIHIEPARPRDDGSRKPEIHHHKKKKRKSRNFNPHNEKKNKKTKYNSRNPNSRDKKFNNNKSKKKHSKNNKK